jgi:hypothetical protein
MQLLDDLKGKHGFWNFKAEVVDLTLWRTGFGRVHGSAARQITE